MDLTWDEVKGDKDVLLTLLREYGSQRSLAKEFGKDHKSIKYWMDQYGITTEDYQLAKTEEELTSEEVSSKQNQKEDKIIEQSDKFTRYEDYHIIHRQKGKDLKIDNKDLKEFRKLYCGSAQMTLAQCERELRTPREQLRDIKNALDITHDSMEFLEEEIKNKEVNEMVDEKLIRKKDLVYKKFKQKEYEQALKDLKRYQKKDYQYKKMTSRILDEIDSLKYQPPELYEVGRENPNKKAVVININDWHKGKVVFSDKILGSGGYNKNKYQVMKEQYTKEAIKLIKRVNPEVVYILNYGDGPDGPNANIYEGQIDHQDVPPERQVVGYGKDLTNFIRSIHEYQPNIVYKAVPVIKPSTLP
mgnify:FL=1